MFRDGGTVRFTEHLKTQKKPIPDTTVLSSEISRVQRPNGYLIPSLLVNGFKEDLTALITLHT
jgi:hypothetical protein